MMPVQARSEDEKTPPPTSSQYASDTVEQAITRFTQQRGDNSFWLTNGAPGKNARRLVWLLQHADQDGLDPQWYGASDLAHRIDIRSNHNSDPNALSPIQLEIEDTSGRVFKVTIDTVIGHPSKPMNRDGWLAKFRNNWRRSMTPLSDNAREQVIERINALECLEDAAMIVDDLVP